MRNKINNWKILRGKNISYLASTSMDEISSSKLSILRLAISRCLLISPRAVSAVLNKIVHL